MAISSRPTPRAVTVPVAGTHKTGKDNIPASTYVALVAVVASLVVVVCGVIAYHLVKDIVIDTKVIAGDSTANSQVGTKLANAKTVVKNYNKLGSTQQLIADALPNDPDFPQLVAMMESISNNASVTLKTVAPSSDGSGTSTTAASTTTTPATSVPSGGAATPYVFSVEVGGQYPQIVAFFQDLELSARPMRVLSATFISSSGTLDATISVQTYYQPQANISDKTKAVK